ncbi:hypothetical protein IF1G_07377 [Cordyceps javanica]|uniref:Uncharacterized protein n=1 Tax=Cordyceps javanica TaxID=43265 RepID=A0A545UW07_9HYPO|nr:hypothetical protein IF1G_07377 [Cordyceps javanica]
MRAGGKPGGLHGRSFFRFGRRISDTLECKNMLQVRFKASLSASSYSAELHHYVCMVADSPITWCRPSRPVAPSFRQHDMRNCNFIRVIPLMEDFCTRFYPLSVYTDYKKTIYR